MESGVDSLAASEFVKLLAVEFGLELSATLLFDCLLYTSDAADE